MAEMPRCLTINQANINNKHLYLRAVLDMFPDDVLGGSKKAQEAPRKVRVLWGREDIMTDIDRTKKIFRQRGWLRRAFDAQRIQAGDHVLLEQLEPYVYRVSRVG